MESFRTIITTVDNMFSLTNERNIMKAYLLLEQLDWSKPKVARYLHLSVNGVNNLNLARQYMTKGTTHANSIFKVNHDTCAESCLKQTKKNFNGRFITQNQITAARLNNAINTK